MTEVNPSRNFGSRLMGKTSNLSDNKKLDQEALRFAQLMNTANSTGTNSSHCKFKSSDKVLAISIDDLDSLSQKMKALTDYLAQKNLPATLFPHKGANPVNIQDMQSRLNEKFGWHGEAKNKLDKNPPSFVDQSVIAWSWGIDGEGKKAEIKGNSNIVARGTLCDRNKGFGSFNQHDVPSCSIGSKYNSQLDKEREKVLSSGGVLSVHMHNSDGLQQLKDTVEKFERKGGKFVYLNQLKGCGKI